MEKLIQKQKKRRKRGKSLEHLERQFMKTELKLSKIWLFHEAIRYRMVCESLKLERKRNPNQYIV